ncbi:hypothetical protein [uncultured Bacteroides sp.]|uniref:hypothetical protein n=1 Tax=uncultured Bacteroides sp. TaxID=162156 RepID=UPI002AAB4CD8|nr:hypothetical protein [uncultured Bacteroides sp.]
MDRNCKSAHLGATIAALPCKITGHVNALGITDMKNLSRQFKTIEGCSPLEYRKEHTPKNN